MSQPTTDASAIQPGMPTPTIPTEFTTAHTLPTMPVMSYGDTSAGQRVPDSLIAEWQKIAATGLPTTVYVGHPPQTSIGSIPAPTPDDAMQLVRSQRDTAIEIAHRVLLIARGISLDAHDEDVLLRDAETDLKPLIQVYKEDQKTDSAPWIR